MATRRWSRSSRARYTTPIPPRPISPSIVKASPRASASRAARGLSTNSDMFRRLVELENRHGKQSVPALGHRQRGGGGDEWGWQSMLWGSTCRVGIPRPRNWGLFGPRSGYLKVERGTPARLKEHNLDRMAARPERNLAWLLVVALWPIAIHDDLPRNAEPGSIVGGEIKGIEGVMGHAQQSQKTKAIILRTFVAPKSHLRYSAHPRRLEPSDIIGRTEAPFQVVILEPGLQAVPDGNRIMPDGASDPDSGNRASPSVGKERPRTHSQGRKLRVHVERAGVGGRAAVSGRSRRWCTGPRLPGRGSQG